MVVVSIYQWMDGMVHLIDGEYWGMIGGDSNTAIIVRCTKDQTVLEQHSINEYEYVLFSSGHNVRITNSTGIMCSLDVYPPPPPEYTLYIDSVNSSLYPAEDQPQQNRYGVAFQVLVKGTGFGRLKISWGTDILESKQGVIAGEHNFAYNLPPGTHKICAELYNIGLER